MQYLTFSPANTKLKKLEKRIGLKVYSLDLLAGWSCPFAKLCKSKVVGDIHGLKIKDGPYTQFRCYSASQEVIYRHVFMNRLKNFQLIKSLSNKPKLLSQLINNSIPKNAQVIRYHVSGDFFCKNYFKAAITVAINNPTRIFYGYTKAIGYFAELQKLMPPNFRLVASLGGTQDSLITNTMFTIKVINNEGEANGLPIDNDDYHAFNPHTNFAILIHGVQPKLKRKVYDKKILQSS